MTCSKGAVFTVTVLVAVCWAQTTIKLGAIFYDRKGIPQLQGMTKFAVDTINNDSKILPNYKIDLVEITAGPLATYASIQAVCKQVTEGVATIIGPASTTAVKASYPMALGVNVPMISPTATDPKFSDDRSTYKNLLRMFPPDSKQSLALIDFIQYFRFDTMAILTDTTDYGINGLLNFQSKAAERNWRVLTVQQFAVTENASAVNAVDQLRQIKRTGARVVILNCYAEHGVVVLQQAENEGMMTEGWMWIGTDGITGTNDLPDALASKPYLKGVVGTRPVAASGANAADFKRRWEAADTAIYKGAGSLGKVPSYGRAFYDAVYTFAHALDQMLEKDKKTLVPASFDCYKIPADTWSSGSDVYDYLLKANFDGVTKKIEFNQKGEPLKAEYDIVVLENTGWEVFGEWKESAPFMMNFTGRFSVGGMPLAEVRDYVGDLHNQTLRVVTIVDPPFVYYEEPSKNESVEGCQGNGCYTGIVMDLLELLADDLKFKYELYLSPDGSYGAQNNSGVWPGMIGELQMKRADMAAAALTITFDREQVVTFTGPFVDLQLGIAMGTPAASFNMWSFLVPLTNQLWLYIILTAVGVALALSLTDKLSPYGHHGSYLQPNDCKKAVLESDEEDVVDINEDGKIDEWEYAAYTKEKHEMSVSNATFWSFASFLQQGGEVHPKSWSGRIAAAAWWFGTLIITATYTANLAAFLTIKTSSNKINSVDDLFMSGEMRYSTVENTQPKSFFDTASREPYKTMGHRMESWGNYFKSASEAVEYTVKEDGKFAFIFDRPMLEFWKGQFCQLKVLQSGFGNVGYGLAVQKGSHYAEELSIKILQYREEGKFDELENKWIKSKANCTTNSASSAIGGDTVQITMQSLMGLVYIMVAGCILALVVLVFEWIWACAVDVNPDDSKKPPNFESSFKRRLQRLKCDILENWFKVKWLRKPTEEHRPSPFQRQMAVPFQAGVPR
ncbi:glutamate receptor 2-like isoform X2 [Lineus longissimus]|uniref:glutamate receptor 2-like isoform X2 n=1 Tax=Lineus longissimus TaxID=88925 RepID=UPI002B4E7C1D